MRIQRATNASDRETDVKSNNQTRRIRKYREGKQKKEGGSDESKKIDKFNSQDQKKLNK